ncbi:MAG: nucleotide-binding protein [Candidatus Bathyarchaeia archaeon]
MERNLTRINPKIFEAILNKARENQPKITERAIYNRIHAVRKEYDNLISLRMAANLLASRMGIDVYRIIKDKNELAELRDLSRILVRGYLKETVPQVVEKRKKVIPKKKLSKKVFIAHGRDYKPVRELKAMLEKFGLKPIVLAEQPSGSRTVVEKLEKYSKDVNYAFVILTPDDGSFNFAALMEIAEKSEAQTLSRKEKDELFLKLFGNIVKKVARQNVILEFGYFIGKLGRDHVCCLYKGDVQLPSDMQGIVYVPFRNSVREAENDIIKELEAVGYDLQTKKRQKSRIHALRS